MDRPRIHELSAEQKLEEFCDGWEEEVDVIDNAIEEIKRVEAASACIVNVEHDGKMYQVELSKPLADDEELVPFADVSTANMYGVQPMSFVIVKKTPNLSPKNRSTYLKVKEYLWRKKKAESPPAVQFQWLPGGVRYWDRQDCPMPPEPKVRFIKG